MKYRRTTSVHYEVSNTQGEMYKRMAQLGYDMEEFSNVYLQSEFCKRAFDTDWSYYQLLSGRECLDALFQNTSISKKRVSGYFDEDVAYWIGFTYRLLYIETKIPSSELMQIITFDSMCKYYPGLHTIDEDQAVDLICEDHNLKIDMDSLNEDKKLEVMAMNGTIHEYNEKLRKQLVDMDLFEDLDK